MGPPLVICGVGSRGPRGAEHNARNIDGQTHSDIDIGKASKKVKQNCEG